MLTLQSVTKQFSDKKHKVTVNALRGINLSFGESGLNFILGKTGCGKTTLLNLIAGIDTHTAGDIVYEGKSFHDFSAKDFERYRNCVVGCIFQEYYLIPYYTVGENIKFALDLQNDGKTEEEKIALVNEALKKVELVDENGEPMYNRSITELSGGQKQRVAIARAIIKKPKILIADEPTGALDFETGRDIFKLLKEFSSERLVIVVTHDEEFAYGFGDRVIRLQHGLVIDDNAPYTAEPGENKRSANDSSPGKLTLPHCIKLGASALTRKRFRLAASLLSMILAITAMGLGVLSVSSDPNVARLGRQYEERSYAILESEMEVTVPDLTDTAEIERDSIRIKEKWQEYGLMPIFPTHLSFEDTVPLDETAIGDIIYPPLAPSDDEGEADEGETDAITFDLHWNAAFSDYRGFLPADESLRLQPDGRFEDKSLCRIPATVDEVAISDLKADAYLKYGFVDAYEVTHTIETPDDLIGLQFKDTFRNSDYRNETRYFTICGVFSTPDSELINNNSLYDHSHISDCVLSCAGDASIVNYFYVCSGFYEKLYASLGRETDDASRFLLSFHKGYFSDVSFLREMNFQRKKYAHRLTVFSIFETTVTDWENVITDFQPYIIGLISLLALFSVFLTINYLIGSMQNRRKEFGVLRSLGAGRGSIFTVFLAECIMIGAITFFVSYGALWLIALVLNVAFFHMPYFMVGWLPTLIVFACSVGCIAIASLFSLLSIRSLTPKDIINAADSGK